MLRLLRLERLGGGTLSASVVVVVGVVNKLGILITGVAFVVVPLLVSVGNVLMRDVGMLGGECVIDFVLVAVAVVVVLFE